MTFWSLLHTLSVRTESIFNASAHRPCPAVWNFPAWHGVRKRKKIHMYVIHVLSHFLAGVRVFLLTYRLVSLAPFVGCWPRFWINTNRDDGAATLMNVHLQLLGSFYLYTSVQICIYPCPEVIKGWRARAGLKLDFHNDRAIVSL